MKRAGLLVALALLAGCGAGDPTGDVDAPSMAPLVRPDTPNNNLLFKFEPGDLVETFGSVGGRFLVHYTRSGPNAVPAADADKSGVPDFVEEVAAVYDEVLEVYQNELGFRAPKSDGAVADNGGDDRFDVYLVDFAGKGDGNYQNDACDPKDPSICAGYMVQENDYAGYGYPSTLVANRILGSHEFFHAVQAAYDKDQGSIPAEGTAVWATEKFDPSLNDFELFAHGFLDNPDRSLDVPLPGPVDPFSYGSGVFFEFLEERYGDGTIRALWERCEDMGSADPVWFEELGPLVKSKDPSASFASMMEELAIWDLFTGKYADPERGYAGGAKYPQVKMVDVEAPFSDDKLRIFYASTQYYRATVGDRAAMTAALVPAGGDASEIEGLSLFVTARRASGYDEVVRIDDLAAGAQTIDTAGAERFVAFVVNTAQGGESKRPGLCIGTADEVAACRAALLGNAGTGGSGGAGGSSGDGGGGSAGSPSEEDEPGCGCRTAPAETSSRAWLSLTAIAVIAAQRRRRRAASASETA